MKKIFAIVLCCIVAFSLLSGCTFTKTETNTVTENGVTTTTTTTTKTENGKTTTDTTVEKSTETAAAADDADVADEEDVTEEEVGEDPNLTFAEAVEDGGLHTATLAIHNSSENDGLIVEMCVAPTGTEDWGDDITDGEPIEPGYYTDAVTLTYDKDHLVWDFRLVDGDGEAIIFDEIDLSPFASDRVDLYFKLKDDGVWNISG